MLPVRVRLFAALVLVAATLSACGPSAACSNDKQAAELLAKFSADVQSASLKNEITMDELKQITIRVDTAGSHYSARKNPTEFCNDINAIRKDFGL